MSNSNHSAKFINMLIALMASIAIALTCIVPTALAEDGDGTDDNNGGSTVQPAGPVPNIIITNFTYGDGSVAVGTNFDLGFTFQNMGKVAVGNMVVTVDGGENFAISGGTNTFYYDSLWAGYSLTQTVPMQVLSSAKNGAQGIDINFKYEYVDGGTRNSNTSDIKISVPVSQPDRFELGDPVLPDAINAGEESTISMEYVNKGKGDVSNVEASIEGDGITATQATQYIGNVASGASGSIGFAFTADAAGENHHLPNGQLVSQAESAVGLAYGETIRIQRRHIVVERGLRRQVGELAGVGFAADKIVRGVLGGPGGDSKSKRQCQHQRGDPFLHDGTSLYKMEDRIQDFCLMEQNADRGLFRRGCPNPPWSGPPHRDSGTG